MSKNTVWVFGDSFSERVQDIPKFNWDGPPQARWEYVNNILNGIPYKLFSEIICEKIGYDYQNYAAMGGILFDKLGGGNSNDQMFYNVTELSSKFKKGDIVFIGFTAVERYQVVTEERGITTVLPNQNMGINTDRYLKNYVDRNQPYYIHEMMQKFKILETLSELVGFKIYYWNWTNQFERCDDLNPKNWITYETYNKLKFFEEIFEENNLVNETIYLESNRTVDDGHWGKEVNDLLAEIFYPTVKKYVDNI